MKIIQRMAYYLNKTISGLLTGCLVVLCLFFGYILFCNIAKMEVPTLGPFRIYIVASDSMAPYMVTNDAVITAETDPEKLEKGDVITFYAFESNTVITHRIVDTVRTDRGCEFWTKGDNNNVEDSFTTPEERVIGKCVLRLPGFGAYLNRVTEKPYTMAVMVAVVIAVQFLSGLAEKHLKLKNKIDDEHGCDGYEKNKTTIE